MFWSDLMAKEVRATCLVIKNDKILLVLDKGGHDYSMPSGGFKQEDNGITLAAGIREVYEETRLKSIFAERLFYCDFEGERANHKVCLIKVEGDVQIDHKELNGYIWWDGNSNIPAQGHVKKILYEFKKRNPMFKKDDL